MCTVQSNGQCRMLNGHLPDIYRTCSAQTEHVQYVYRAQRTANVWLQVTWRMQWRVYKLAGLATGNTPSSDPEECTSWWKVKHLEKEGGRGRRRLLHHLPDHLHLHLLPSAAMMMIGQIVHNQSSRLQSPNRLIMNLPPKTNIHKTKEEPLVWWRLEPRSPAAKCRRAIASFIPGSMGALKNVCCFHIREPIRRSSSSNISGGIRMKFVNDWESSLRSSTISWSYRPNCRRRSGLSQALDHHLLLCRLLRLLLANTWARMSNCACWRCSCACKRAALYCNASLTIVPRTGVRSGMRTETRAPLFILHHSFGPCPVLVLWIIVAYPVLILYLSCIHSVFIRFSRFVRWPIRCQYCTYVYCPA